MRACGRAPATECRSRASSCPRRSRRSPRRDAERKADVDVFQVVLARRPAPRAWPCGSRRSACGSIERAAGHVSRRSGCRVALPSSAGVPLEYRLAAELPRARARNRRRGRRRGWSPRRARRRARCCRGRADAAASRSAAGCRAGCRPMLGSSSTYITPESSLPSWLARRMRCASPPHSVGPERSSVR